MFILSARALRHAVCASTLAGAGTDAEPDVDNGSESGGLSGGTTVTPLMLMGAEVELVGGVELGAPRNAVR